MKSAGSKLLTDDYLPAAYLPGSPQPRAVFTQLRQSSGLPTPGLTCCQQVVFS